jgi:hypothetical protein
MTGDPMVPDEAVDQFAAEYLLHDPEGELDHEALHAALAAAYAVAGERIANALSDRAHEDMYVMEPGCISIGWAQSIARAEAAGDQHHQGGDE